MDRIIQLAGGIPPVTRCWLIAIMALSAATLAGLVHANQLLFVPEKALTSQWWRLITSFCYFGDLLVETVLHIYFISQSFGMIEQLFATTEAHLPRHYQLLLDSTRRRRLDESLNATKTVDFVHYLTMVCVLIVAAVTVVFYTKNVVLVHLGPIFDSVMMYVWCRSNPLAEVRVFGVVMRAAYVPWVMLLGSWVMSPEFRYDLMFLTSGTLKGLQQVLKRPFVWNTLVRFGIGHFWWYTRLFLLEKVYYDLSSSRRETTLRVARKYQKLPPQAIVRSWYRELLLTLVLPPWYWTILRNLEADQAREERTVDEVPVEAFAEENGE